MNRHPPTASPGPRPGRRTASNLPLLQRAAVRAGETPAVPPIVHDVLRSPGEPLDVATRAALGAALWARFQPGARPTPMGWRPSRRGR